MPLVRRRENVSDGLERFSKMLVWGVWLFMLVLGFSLYSLWLLKRYDLSKRELGENPIQIRSATHRR
jgi:hypothetical protein